MDAGATSGAVKAPASFSEVLQRAPRRFAKAVAIRDVTSVSDDDGSRDRRWLDWRPVAKMSQVVDSTVGRIHRGARVSGR